MTDAQAGEARANVRLGGVRVAIGLAQGGALYALGAHAFRGPESAAATAAGHGPPGASLWLVALFAPPIVLVGLGRVRPVTLTIWTAAASALLFGLGLYDAWRGGDGGSSSPGLALFPVAAALVFIAHHLIEGGDRERRLIAPYGIYFDIAWTHGVQIALAALFTLVFWIVLSVGALLFAMIGVRGFGDFISKPVFMAPVLAGAFAAAIHITDRRAALVIGARTLALTLLSWLLPVAAAIAGAFLLALAFTGLKPLWDTRAATTGLIFAASGLIILINAVYKDGRGDQSIVLRWAVRVAAPLTLALGGLASYALFLRTAQYGLTPERIVATAILLVIVCYAAGYSVAAVSKGAWMARLEPVNVATAFVVLAVLLALFTPIADPARLSVADQIARLDRGAIAPQAFDYSFLRTRAARYGAHALTTLAHRKGDARALEIAKLADLAIHLSEGVSTAEPVDVAAFKVSPQGKTLPADFVAFARTGIAGGALCFSDADQCEAIMIDLDADGSDEIVVGSSDYVRVYARAAHGAWRSMGGLSPSCPGTLAALREGRYRLAPPRFRNVRINGIDLALATDQCNGEDDEAGAHAGQQPAAPAKATPPR